MITVVVDPVILWLGVSLLIVLVTGAWILGRGDRYVDSMNRVYRLTAINWVDRWVTLGLAIGGIGSSVVLLIVLAAGFASLV